MRDAALPVHSSFHIPHPCKMDLFDFFKENEAKLNEQPSEKAWQKLEKRLDSRRTRRQRRIRFLQLGAVALAIFLLLLAAGLVWYFAR